MSLHKKNDLGRKTLDVIDPASDVPKYKIPREERSPRDAYALVHDELLLDGNARQNLATFCTTLMDPETQALMAECSDKNMCDKDEYPQTAEIESRCVHILADLWNSPAAANTIGCSTTGSSEAAMLGGLAAKWRWRARMRAQGKPTDRPNLGAFAASDSSSAGLVIFNYNSTFTTTDETVDVELDNLPFNGVVTAERYLVDASTSNLWAYLRQFGPDGRPK